MFQDMCKALCTCCWLPIFLIMAAHWDHWAKKWKYQCFTIHLDLIDVEQDSHSSTSLHNSSSHCQQSIGYLINYAVWVVQGPAIFIIVTIFVFSFKSDPNQKAVLRTTSVQDFIRKQIKVLRKQTIYGKNF